MPRRDLVAVVVSALLGGGLAWLLARPAPLPPPHTTRLAVAIPAGQRLDALAISPDGSRIVYAAEGDGRVQLYRRVLDRFDVERIPNTEGAHSPFFSPDSQSVGFFADGMLRKIPVDGTHAFENVCEAPADSAGGAWSEDGSIVFAPLHGRGLVKVSAAGAALQPLTQPDKRAGEIAHGWPQALAKGKGVLFTVSRRGRESRIAVLTADGKVRQLMFPATGQARYLPSGHLVYGFLGELLAVPFDVDEMRPDGVPVAIAQGLRSSRGFDDLEMTWFSSSLDGSLVYVSGTPGDPSSALVWVDREGRATPLSATLGQYQSPRLTADGQRLAVAVRSGLMSRDLWIHDIAQDTRVRLTTEGGDNQSPVWMPDGRRLTYASTKDGSQNIYVKPLDAGAEPQLLVAGGAVHNPSSWSRDGRVLAYYDVDPATGRDIWMLDRSGVITPVLATAANERSPSLSPDGAWMAYVSDESGSDGVYLRLTEKPDTARRISTSGGTEPLWSRDGNEIFYRQADRMMAVPVTIGPPLSVGAPRVLFERRYALDPSGNLPNYDASVDGRRFVMLQSADPPVELRVILNWLTSVRETETRQASPTRGR
jgi:eukaryotic-like serine/threonine-protein kinase